MHLALNFQRVDPSRGGAETYVADLCRDLVAGGHRVDLYAESWADDCLPARGERRSRRRHRPQQAGAHLELRRNSEQAMRHGRHDCSVGFINTWAHDVIIPQGGVQEGSLRANAGRFSTAVHGQAYRLVEDGQSQVLGASRDRAPAIRPRAARRGSWPSARWSAGISKSFTTCPGSRSTSCPTRSTPARLEVAQPGAFRCAFRNRMGLEPSDLVGLFVGHNFALKGLEPLIEALGARQRRNPRAGRSTCWSAAAATPPPIAAWRAAWDRGHGPFPRLLSRIRECYWSSDFFVQPTYYDPCSLVVLEALACGLPVITTEQNGAERADDRRP